MICPVCKKDMIVVEYNKIELDYCDKCKGVWFDSGELELLLKSVSLEDNSILVKNILSSPEAATAEQKRKCPLCNKKMKKVNIGEPGILIDACEQGEGLWFDGGEVIKLVRQLSATKSIKKDGSQQNMVDFLAEVFHAQE